MNLKKTALYKLLLLSTLLLGLSQVCFNESAEAQGRKPLFNLDLNGSYTERFSEYKTNFIKSWGAELRVPVSSFFEVSVGHNFKEDRDVFNSKYRDLQESEGYTLPSGKIESIDTYIDTTVNSALYYTFGYIRPSIFGGPLWRTYCSETTVADYGCKDNDVTWNAGVALSVMVTYNLKLRSSFRISPSGLDKSTGNEFDKTTSFGITFAL